MIHRARVLLIELGKALPFFVCAVVLFSYIECLAALIFDDYAIYDDTIVLYKPISWWIGRYFEYNLITIFILIIISVAAETCYWNKLAILYLLVQLGEKTCFQRIELYKEYIYAIVFMNIAISGILVYKGIIITFNKKHKTTRQ